MPQQFLDDFPCKLVYVGSDSGGVGLIRSNLGASAEGSYRITSFNSLNKMKAVDLPSYCHAVILDLREAEGQGSEAMEWVGEVQWPVALICLCEDYNQIKDYEDHLHWVDEIVVADLLQPGELPIRLSRAIRNRRAGLGLHRDQELLSALLNNVPDSIYFKDRDCRFIRVNAAKAKKHNTSPAQMTGKTDFDYFTEERARPAYEEEQTIMRTGEPVLGEIQKLTFDDGSVGWVNTSKLPLNDKFGRVMGTMGISRDVTQQIENEQKLKEAQRKLDESE